MDENILERFCKESEVLFLGKVHKEDFGKRIIFDDSNKRGELYQVMLDEGLGFTKCAVEFAKKIIYQNAHTDEDVLEVGLCIEGHAKFQSKPDGKAFEVNAGDVFIYKFRNDVETFLFSYEKFKSMSIIINIDFIRTSTLNGYFANVELDFSNLIHSLLYEDIIVIKRASNDIVQLSNEIYALDLVDMISYMGLKGKTFELVWKIIEMQNRQVNQEKTRMPLESTVKNVIQIIHKDLENVPTVKELAEYVNMPVLKLQGLFKQQMNTTIYAYIIQERIQKAAELLILTELSVLEITHEVGYENPSKFSNLFKRHMGITPLKFRKENQV